MAKLSRTLLSAAVCLLAAVCILHGAPVDFPKDEPAFSITFPETWKTNFTGKNRLTAQPKSGANLLCTVLPAEKIKDDPGARSAMPTFAEEFLGRMGIDLKSLAPTESLNEVETGNGITVFAQEWRGKNRKGEEVVVTAGLFAVEPGDYYAIIFVGSPEADKEFEADQSAIVESISVEE